MEALRDSDEYRSFFSCIPKKEILVEEWSGEAWNVYDGGPRDDPRPPILFLPPLSGRADCYYRQMLALAGLGHRVISADYPPLYTLEEFSVSCERFLDTMNIERVHIFGASLGGYLAQAFAERNRSRVASLILCNSFHDTSIFNRASTAFLYWALPGWLLKRMVLQGLPTLPQEPAITAAVDFMVESLESLPQHHLAARLILNCERGAIDVSRMPITLVDVMDQCALSEKARESLRMAYPTARHATMKRGGNFPFLSHADQLNLFIRVHLNAMNQA